MSTDNLDAADLIAVALDGLINEQVLQQIFDISKIPLPFQDSIGVGERVTNPYTSWTVDDLGPADPTNAVVDGSDAGADESTTGERVGNHCQESQKTYRVSQRAINVDTIGRANELAYQTMRGQQKLRRDVESILLLNQASIADDGNAQPGLLGGYPSWISTNVTGGTGFVAGGFDNVTGNTVAFTSGTAPLPLTETIIRDIAELIWNEGGDPSVLMSSSGVIRAISEYMFTSSARIATFNRETRPDGQSAAEALGSVNVFITDFEVVLEMRANRIQESYTNGDLSTTVDFVEIYDPAFWNQGFLQGYESAPLAKTGLADNRQLSVDYTLRCLNELSSGLIGDVDPTAAVTQ